MSNESSNETFRSNKLSDAQQKALQINKLSDAQQKALQINKLSDAQQKALQTLEGPHLLLAVPGSGKTTVILARIMHLVFEHNVPSQNILTLTFSRVQALDMKARFNKDYGNMINSKPRFQTIHSFCYEVLKASVKKKGEHVPKLLQSSDRTFGLQAVIHMIYREVHQFSPTYYQIDEFLNAIHMYKNHLKTKQCLDILSKKVPAFEMMFLKYEAYKTENRLIDFDDMLERAFTVFVQDRALRKMFQDKYTYIQVDEAQDTSNLQHEMLKILVGKKGNIFMVGDEDQTIYGFRGADPSFLMHFREHYPHAELHFMEQNYRSTKSIVSYANNFIQNNHHRYPKQMHSNQIQGEEVCVKNFRTRKKALNFMVKACKENWASGELAILYRNHLSCMALVYHLIRLNIPFRIKTDGNDFFEHWIYKDVISFFQFAIEPHNLEAFRRIHTKLGISIPGKVFQLIEKKAVLQEAPNDIFALLSNLELPHPLKNNFKTLSNLFKTLARVKTKNGLFFILKMFHYEQIVHNNTRGNVHAAKRAGIMLDTIQTMLENAGSVRDFLMEQARFKEDLNQPSRGKEGVFLSTIHGAKGLEFKTVFVIDLVHGVFPSEQHDPFQTTDDDSWKEEEARLFYVALTRAKEQLFLIRFRKAFNRTYERSNFMHVNKRGVFWRLQTRVIEGFQKLLDLMLSKQ